MHFTFFIFFLRLLIVQVLSGMTIATKTIQLFSSLLTARLVAVWSDHIPSFWHSTLEKLRLCFKFKASLCVALLSGVATGHHGWGGGRVGGGGHVVPGS